MKMCALKEAGPCIGEPIVGRAMGLYRASRSSASLFVKFFTISARTLASDCGAIRYIVLIYQKILTVSSSTPKSASFSK